jgi:hypothetical protein
LLPCSGRFCRMPGARLALPGFAVRIQGKSTQGNLFVGTNP